MFTFCCSHSTNKATRGKKLPFVLTAVIYLLLTWAVELSTFCNMIKVPFASPRSNYWLVKAFEFGRVIILLAWLLFIPDLRKIFLCIKSVENEPLEISMRQSHTLNVTNTRKTSVRSCSSTQKMSILSPQRLVVFLCSRTRALSWSDNNYRPPTEWTWLCFQSCLSVRHTVYGGEGSCTEPQLSLPSVQDPSPVSIQGPSSPPPSPGHVESCST